MPRVAVEDNERISLRVRTEDKATLLRAVALMHSDLTAFVLQHALPAARAVIEEAERIRLSERTVSGYSTCWKIRLRRTRNCGPLQKPCPGGHERDGMARRARQQGA